MNCSICQNANDAYYTHTYIINGIEKDVCTTCITKEKGTILRLFKIPSGNLPVLEKKLKKLERRATKCGLPAPSYSEIRTERLIKNKGLDNEKVILLHCITIDTGVAEVKINGYKFIATIQHTEEGNILRKIGEDYIPPEYRNTDNHCDHCQKIRNRKDTYLLVKEE